MYFKIVTYFFNHTQFIAIARLGRKQRALALCFLTDLQHVHFHQWRTKYGSPRAFSVPGQTINWPTTPYGIKRKVVQK